ncbi:UL37 immediate early glycoprotein [Dissostichus eleginoides]|uniref:UL37 immediate early glycoprotein n=1 Tax=Dissostichus eleginoides TaxID=100907 RepID=A0AAD9BTT2_DISEL|nr:UL37 immediate early glycoprotein [Dissostichus eleginoides]
MSSEPTAQTEPETSDPAETFSTPEQTNPTDRVTSDSGQTTMSSDLTGSTDTVTSDPLEPPWYLNQLVRQIQ